MRKFGFFATTAVILAGFAGWIASTSQARVTAPMLSAPQISTMQMMTGAVNLPAEHFVDYSLVIWNASSLHNKERSEVKGERSWRKHVCEAGRSRRWC